MKVTWNMDIPSVEESLPEDEPALRALTRSASLARANILVLLCEEGQRQKQWAGGSPVPSSFFR